MTGADSYVLLRAFCDELGRCGVRYACTSPGSRCTPIVLSLVREPRIRCFSHIDERCAGFFALGAAKSSGTPVAVTCTSGTAAVNLAPAVVEAHQAGVPLIVLTADRPPELREVGAGQTIDQLKLYGGAVKWFFEVGVDDAEPETVRWIRALACRACWTALDQRPGPVHLNFPLREPLVVDERHAPDPVPGRPAERPWVTRSARAPTGAPGKLPAPAARGVIVAGRQERHPALGRELAAFAQRAGYPLLADPLSGARHGPAAVARYDLLLRDGRFTATVRPELVLRVGDLPTSKPLRTWLASLHDTEQIAWGSASSWQDPKGVITAMQDLPLGALSSGAPRTPADPGWLARWRAADDAASAAIAQALGDELSEPLVAAHLSEWLEPETTLFVASSMPVRDVELFFGLEESAPRVLSNRGANGIDGTVSCAFGAAAAADGPVVLLVGDVAVAHDVGGLLAARRLGLALTIVLLNNDGGGIFHFLEVAGERDVFEEHVATPHGLDFSRAAALYGCEYERPATTAELRAAVQSSVAADSTTIIEVRTDREQNIALHRRVAEAVRARLG
ncbi:MAG: 2-succinyl-5-enolpyruvyl-6-hydroxy-3-cyclohexene-1-carboxylic-acid synthase [Solirubrobacterales bacterium]|nr:2-succinyl-5-enolpyruvyl-6-hydroxy-3-cyclohexene-1-carboxylic-acid synthase [Solirubrobacterales bacterium]